jgi:shikimate kinase / 3-dehydroquinate synthase
MPARRPQRIFLTGFSFTGKSLVAPLVAEALRWRAVDLDDLIEEAAGRPVPQIFAGEGEPGFRRREQEALREACRQEGIVVATGGGVVLAEENRRAMGEGGFVVCLEARPETILHRMREADGGSTSERPLLQGSDPLSRIRRLKALRQPLYALADCAVHTDELSPEQVAAEVVRAWRRYSAVSSRESGRLAETGGGQTPRALEAGTADVACWVTTETARYPVYVGWGILAQLGKRMRAAGLTGTAYLFSDSNVHRHYGERLKEELRGAGFATDYHVVPAGETSKDLTIASDIYDWLAERRAERGHTVVALGGGMVGDLAGFVAATYLRGMPVVQAPTSLLAMVDAAIGGKVAVNHREGKNLIGAFHQPRLVLADVSALKTLPARELTSGWAEVIKHALIMDGDLLRTLEEDAERLVKLDPDVTVPVVSRAMALKAQVVSEDERETTGRRTILNYGHTVGHGLEAASRYEALLHGEAVALGMIAAAAIGRRLGVTPPALADRQNALLARFGLPARVRGIDPEDVLRAITLDKKTSDGSVRWVLLEDVGQPVLRADVPVPLVRQVIEEMLEP